MRLERDGSLISRTTGLTLRPEGLRLRLVDPATGERLPWREEIEEARIQAEERARNAQKRAAEEAAARQAAEEQARREAVAREAVEERIRVLEQELERLLRQAADDAG